MLCAVYKSDRTNEMYLYMPYGESLENLPDKLLEEFAQRQQVLVVELTSERQLARADASSVIEAIGQQGYYLQMPPTHSDQSGMIDTNNHMMPRGN